MGNKSFLLAERSFSFSVRIFKLYSYLKEEKNDYILSKQILRAGTSIGANIAESKEGQTTKDHISKLYIALKEARETEYWIKYLLAIGYISLKGCQSLSDDLNIIISLLIKAIKAAKKRDNL